MSGPVPSGSSYAQSGRALNTYQKNKFLKIIYLYRNKLHAIDSKPDNDFGAQLDDFHHDHHEGFENDFPNGDSLGDDKNFEVIPKKVKQKRRKKLKGSVSLVMES